ncbi:aminoglycoside phosphotransferase family protein [Nocardia jejuensis]|uniref:aminoglycoside phosphotransferase family protein n=1 Tax=Nocardia jejuensis TaxID=328049 RepID=UPI0008295411|nr:aminoglycoside phosphotransferase family protein [Nocardia jejuensis]
MTISLPQDVADTIREIFGERGKRWLRDLPTVVEELCAQWDVTLIGDGFSGGTHSFVAPVRRDDDSTAVLKVPVIDPENIGEAAGLFCYAGEGAVRMYEFDSGSNSMLLEWAKPGTELVYQPGFPSLEGEARNIDKVEFACTLYKRLRREPAGIPADYPALPLAADMVSQWTRMFSDMKPELAQLIPAHLRELAADWCARLRVPDGPLLVVNRDTHLGNIIAAEREPWLLIDPKAYLGEAAFDAGFLIMIQVQSWPTPEQARTVVERTATGMEVDPERARGWAFMRAMEEIVWAHEDQEPEDLALHLAVATALA